VERAQLALLFLVRIFVIGVLWATAAMRILICSKLAVIWQARRSDRASAPSV
jgi:hypothetical protein